MKHIAPEGFVSRLFTALFAVVLMVALLSGTVSAEGVGSFPAYSAAELFAERDLVQEADLRGSKAITVVSGQDIRIASEGVYVLNGLAEGMTVYVDAGPKDKVQLVLDNVTVTNEDFPCIYVLSADKVFITVSADSALSVTGAFRADGNTKTDGVIFSRPDLVLCGTASLALSSSAHGVVCKDDLKITGGTYDIRAEKKAVDANDSIRIAGGTFTLSAGTDGLHAENKSDASRGFIWIGGGTFSITAGDEGIHAATVLQVDGGAFTIQSREGMAAAVIRISGSPE